MTKHELAHRLHSPLFATRSTIQEASEELKREIELGCDHFAGIYAAVQILLNTIAQEIEKAE